MTISLEKILPFSASYRRFQIGAAIGLTRLILFQFEEVI